MNKRAAKQRLVLSIKLALESMHAPYFDHSVHLQKLRLICTSAQITTVIETLPHPLQSRGMSDETPHRSRLRNGPHFCLLRGQWCTDPFPTLSFPTVVGRELRRLCLDRYQESKRD